MNETVKNVVRLLGLGTFFATITGALPLGLIGIIVGVYLMTFDKINPYLSRLTDTIT